MGIQIWICFIFFLVSIPWKEKRKKIVKEGIYKRVSCWTRKQEASLILHHVKWLPLELIIFKNDITHPLPFGSRFDLVDFSWDSFGHIMDLLMNHRPSWEIRDFLSYYNYIVVTRSRVLLVSSCISQCLCIGRFPH